jgi:hypothetical protein
MDWERLHRLDAEVHRPTKPAEAEPPEPKFPGKRTLVEQLEHPMPLDRHTAKAMGPGRRTLVELEYKTPARLGFEDHRVIALRDLCRRLGPDHPLREEVLAAADRRIALRALPWFPAPSEAPAACGTRPSAAQ